MTSNKAIQIVLVAVAGLTCTESSCHQGYLKRRCSIDSSSCWVKTETSSKTGINAMSVETTNSVHREKRESIQPLSNDSSAPQENRNIHYSNDGKNVILRLNNETIKGPILVNIDNTVVYDRDGSEDDGSERRVNNPATSQANNTNIPASPVHVNDTIHEKSAPNHSSTMPKPVNFLIFLFMIQILVVGKNALSFC